MKILYRLSVVALTIMYIALAIWLYWSLAPYKTITYLNDPFPVTPGEPLTIKQGEELTYNLHYCKYTDDMPIELHKEFVDGIIYEAADQKALITGQGCGEIDVPVLIPVNLPPGEYRLRITVIYKVNPIRKITKVSETQEFIITRAADGAYGDETNEYDQPTN